MGGKVLAEMDNGVEIGDTEVGSRWADKDSRELKGRSEAVKREKEKG